MKPDAGPYDIADLTGLELCCGLLKAWQKFTRSKRPQKPTSFSRGTVGILSCQGRELSTVTHLLQHRFSFRPQALFILFGGIWGKEKQNMAHRLSPCHL